MAEFATHDKVRIFYMAYKPRNNANFVYKSTVSILRLPLCQHQFAPSHILCFLKLLQEAAVISYRRNFHLQVITDS